jgi:hypothetical protein
VFLANWLGAWMKRVIEELIAIFKYWVNWEQGFAVEKKYCREDRTGVIREMLNSLVERYGLNSHQSPWICHILFCRSASGVLLMKSDLTRCSDWNKTFPILTLSCLATKNHDANHSWAKNWTLIQTWIISRHCEQAPMASLIEYHETYQIISRIPIEVDISMTFGHFWMIW